jgi:hypothetical protein
VANIAQISFSKKLFGDQNSLVITGKHPSLSKIRHLPNIGFAQSGSIGLWASTRDKR